jgi:hypothetical protein
MIFRFRWNWTEGKKLRGFRLQISSLSILEGVVILKILVVIAVKMRQKGMKDICFFCENSILKNKLLYHSFQKSMHSAF